MYLRFLDTREEDISELRDSDGEDEVELSDISEEEF